MFANKTEILFVCKNWPRKVRSMSDHGGDLKVIKKVVSYRKM